MSRRIQLRCPDCKRTASVLREKFDPAAAVVCEIACPECVGSDFDNASYRDAKGREIIEDPRNAKPRTRARGKRT